MIILRRKYLILPLLAILLGVITIWIVIPMINERKKCVSLEKEWIAHLRAYPTFSAKKTAYELDVNYYYAGPEDLKLGELRESFKLDSIAGNGSEMDTIINLMTWVYQLTGHENEPDIPQERNAFTLIHMAKDEKKQINCYMKTIILNEVYLSMGFYSRHAHLLPYSDDDPYSHFITSVFSKSLGKWILMDPDFGVYITDPNGQLLGIDEIRSRLISGEALNTVHVGRNSLKLVWTNVSNMIEGADYLWFLSCFLFKMRCPVNSLFDQYAQPVRPYYELIPDGYQPELLQGPRLTDNRKMIYSINDKSQFWQDPRVQNRVLPLVPGP